MKKAEVQKLAHGVYRVFWKTGSSSVAAVGSTADGTRWLAPSNWLWPSEKHWRYVDHVKLIETQEGK